jgi:nicrotizing toxin Mtb-like protein
VAPLPPGHKTEREQLVAILLVHMFPFGHMPVAATEPARQLPVPPPEIDYAAGMRFEPDDHPESHLVGAATPPQRIPVVDPLNAGDEVVQDLLTGHDTLGELHERDWDRKFLVRPAGPHGDVEYAWPPCELYPEGGTAPGEPEVLDVGTVIDRFGREDGRVFAAVETPFAQRSLPPSHVDLAYRRYRVVTPIPVWRSLSAAWFAQPGGGVRYRTTRSVAELVALGHLEDVTREATP